MGACQGLGKARIGVGILVNIGWWGVPKNVGPQDRSKLKTPMLAEEISAWRPQKPYFRPKNIGFYINFCYFPLFGGPPGGPASGLMLQYAFCAYHHCMPDLLAGMPGR